VENRTAEEKIQARLRELTDELRQLRKEMSDDHSRRRSPADPPSRKPSLPSRPARPKR
jgi:uncharacterized coiled-coil protein SlyX